MKVPSATRVTQRQIATAARVSLATVSLALRGDTRITEPIRRRVQRVARQLGYRPDPHVSALMSGLRSRSAAAVRGNIAILPTLAEFQPAARPYMQAIRDGAVTYAESRGYPVIHVGLQQHGGNLGRVLYARGVSGIVLLPLPEPQQLDGLTDWSKFSVVATSYTVLAPRFHLVVPHHAANMQQTIDRLAGAGYRRLGLLLSGRGFITRVNRAFLAVLALHARDAGRAAVEPLIVDGAGYISDALPRWLKRTRPDVILTNNAPVTAGVLARLGLRVPEDIGLMDLGADHGERFARFDQLPRALGEEAAFRLISMMHRGERGEPARPFVSMLEGAFLAGASLRSGSAVAAES